MRVKEFRLGSMKNICQMFLFLDLDFILKIRQKNKQTEVYHVLPQFLSPYRNGICWLAGDNVFLVDFLRISKRVKEFRRFSLEFIALVFIPDDELKFLNIIGEVE